MSEQTPDLDETFADLRKIAKTVTTDDYWREAPPDDVWDKIAAGIGRPESATNVSPLRRPGSRAPLLAAAAAALIMFIVVGALATRALRSASEPEVAGGADLVNTDLPVSSDATAAVELLLDDGTYRLDVDLSEVPDAGDGVLELWIIDENVESMFSLGAIDSDGSFELPPGVDPADFPIVDISVEPLDGDPTHSGQSVLRGVLDQPAS